MCGISRRLDRDRCARQPDRQRSGGFERIERGTNASGERGVNCLNRGHGRRG